MGCNQTIPDMPECGGQKKADYTKGSNVWGQADAMPVDGDIIDMVEVDGKFVNPNLPVVPKPTVHKPQPSFYTTSNPEQKTWVKDHLEYGRQVHADFF